jgi:Domain of unknown function (DUF927)
MTPAKVSSSKASSNCCAQNAALWRFCLISSDSSGPAASWNPPERYAAALSTGWYSEEVFVLPDEIITLENHPEKVWYQGGTRSRLMPGAGTLEEWQANIGAGAIGNPYLIGAICAGFAGPLLYKFGVHGADHSLLRAVYYRQDYLPLGGRIGVGRGDCGWQEPVCSNLVEHCGGNRGICQPDRSALRYYGHAGPAFARKKIEENPTWTSCSPGPRRTSHLTSANRR